MSFYATSRVMTWRGELTATEMAVALMLAWFANQDHNDACFPSVKKLGDQVLLKERQARIILARLEEKGVIAREKEFRKGKGQTTNSYFINYNHNSDWTEIRGNVREQQGLESTPRHYNAGAQQQGFGDTHPALQCRPPRHYSAGILIEEYKEKQECVHTSADAASVTQKKVINFIRRKHRNTDTENPQPITSTEKPAGTERRNRNADTENQQPITLTEKPAAPKKRMRRRPSTKPTVADIQEEALKLGYSAAVWVDGGEAQRFWEYYEAIDWRRGSARIKKLQFVIKPWEERRKSKPRNTPGREYNDLDPLGLGNYC